MNVPPRRLRVLFVQPSIQPPGGGNAITVWMVEALKDEYEIHLLLWAPPDLDEINVYYGTRLTPDSFSIHLAPRAIRAFIGGLARLLGTSLDLLIRMLMLRTAARLEAGFDLVISGSNELQSGKPAIQYIHFPWGYWPRPETDLRPVHRLPGVLRLYYGLAHSLFPVRPERIARNLTLVNSQWTGEHYRSLYGGDYEVVFPPIGGEPPQYPWEQRPGDFIALGRISREKRYELAMAAIEAVRATGREITLRIAGSRNDPSYLAYLQSLAASRPWVSIETDLSRPGILHALASHRYGIHAMKEEHFGMAVAEMVIAGCIPFVPSGGGAVEIIGHDERLIWNDPAEAAQKIVRVMESSELQRELRADLARSRETFTAATFVRRVRELTRDFVQKQGLVASPDRDAPPSAS